MKIIAFLTTTIVIVAIGLIIPVRALSEDIPGLPDIPIDGEYHCCCKDNGCYGTNPISFRPLCGLSDEIIDCTELNMNCPGYDPNWEENDVEQI